ncbi:MAG: SLBB domain-containing protein [Pyrinomonadaceae bacterium]
MKVKFLLFILTVSLFQIAIGQEAPANPDQSGYLVGPGDEIVGKVLGEPQFDFVATIDEDGKFQVPFFDQGVMAKCRTEKELRSDVRQLLSKYLKSPLVSVNVTKRNSRPPATIYGEVRQPQRVDLQRKATLLELLSFSGGVTEDAGGIIQVFRTRPPMCGDASQEAEWKSGTNDGFDVPSRLYSLSSVKQGREDANPIIYPGDVIVVLKALPVYITGEVASPQGLYLKENGLTLTEAIAKIGGVRREAKTKDIKIYRLKDNSKERQVIAVNYDSIKKGTQKDVLLEPYDIVEVDKSKKSVLQIAMEIATGAARTGISSVSGGLGTRILY